MSRLSGHGWELCLGANGAKHTISVANPWIPARAVLFSGLPAVGGLPGWFHHPCLGMARAGPSRSIGPLPGGSMGFFTIIKH